MTENEAQRVVSAFGAIGSAVESQRAYRHFMLMFPEWKYLVEAYFEANGWAFIDPGDYTLEDPRGWDWDFIMKQYRERRAT